MEIISWKPRISMLHDFLDKGECEHLIKLAKSYKENSLSQDLKTRKGKERSARTSTFMFLNRGEDLVVQAIEKRIAHFAFLPEENGEMLQIVNYEVGQREHLHVDYFNDDAAPNYFNVDAAPNEDMGQRAVTVLMYLSDVEEGGETEFPIARINVTSSLPNEMPKIGCSFKPKMGNALLFWNVLPDCSPDPASGHAALPVIKGSKWVGIKWLRTKPVKDSSFPAKGGNSSNVASRENK